MTQIQIMTTGKSSLDNKPNNFNEGFLSKEIHGMVKMILEIE
jgi:hypothetical protein